MIRKGLLAILTVLFFVTLLALVSGYLNFFPRSTPGSQLRPQSQRKPVEGFALPIRIAASCWIRCEVYRGHAGMLVAYATEKQMIDDLTNDDGWSVNRRPCLYPKITETFSKSGVKISSIGRDNLLEENFLASWGRLPVDTAIGPTAQVHFPYVFAMGGPLWPLALLFGAYPMIAFVRGPIRRFRRRRQGLCIECAYDLRGNTSGVCPECGTATTVSMSKMLHG